MSSPKPSAPHAVRWIARKLEEAGHDTWAVGGAVRDVLLGRPSGDWDLATGARPAEVQRIFRRTVPLGVEHGTVGVLKDDTLYEVTTFRRDVETDGRHAVVAFAQTIEEDLARRDFTINAIAWHPLREELLDPFGGVADMERLVLRTVGRPEERFREDYLRILRAFRFAGLFRMEIEAATWAALCELVDHLTSLSAERIRDELVKVLDADAAPSRALGLYAASGALRVLYAELEALSHAWPGGRERWALSMGAVDEVPKGRSMLRLAALLRELTPAETAALLMRLRFSNAQVDETAYRAAAAPLPEASADSAAFRRWLSASGPGRLAALARLDLARALAERRIGAADRVGAVVASWRRARTVRGSAPPLAVGDLALDGRGLIALGLKPGPHFGRILDELLDWVLEDPTRNERQQLAERALALAQKERTSG
ncbi:MAG: CCA tRNA nucleotidyltransferase [Gemmatimonadetes bacterium]|nr:CCA tRNA nucleotidyltransferase [Gemmatimonadota bacterium]